MEAKPFGWTGEEVTPLGMGTYYDVPWILKARLGRAGGSETKVDALKAGIEAGVKMIDTAEIYNSEPLVARAVAGVPREGLFIATKVLFLHLRRDALVRALERSLRRLGTDYVDLYQVHQPSPFVPIKETMSAMEEMVERGLVRHIGISNFSLKQTVEASESLKKCRLASTQMPYHLADRRVEREILPYCREQKMALLAYYPLGHGKLVGGEAISRIARRLGKTPAQVALNWLLSHENVFPIPRASVRAHVEENAGSVGWKLAASDEAELEEAYPPPA
jgi:diketogulonate reductase-like aldo/keto reductase